MTKIAEIYDFLKQRYKHDRFEGRNGAWCRDYSSLVAQSTLASLEKHGEAMISRHESINGLAVRFNSDLEVLSV